MFIKLRDRIVKLHSLFFDDEDRNEEWDDLLSDINTALSPYYVDDFKNLFDAADALLEQFKDYEEENEAPEHTAEGALVIAHHGGEDAVEAESELDREIRLGEAAEEEDEDDDNVDE